MNATQATAESNGVSIKKTAIARAYCASIGETDPEIIEDVINQCRHSAEAQAYRVQAYAGGAVQSIVVVGGAE